MVLYITKSQCVHNIKGDKKMEENFEKKSSKKIAITILVIVLVLILAVIAGLIYLSFARKPEKIFGKAIEETFEMTEQEEAKAAKIELELSLEIESEDAEMKAANEILKAIKLKSTTEIDLDKKILNENILATYDGEQIISLDALVQNETMYLYLNEIYDRYIEINEEYLEGLDLSTIFETNAEVASEDLIKDIKQLLLDEVNSRELTQEKVELDGENLQKSTLRLTPREVLEITLEMAKILNEYQPTAELSDLIAELEYEMEDLEDTENYVDISMYTKGLNNKLVKADAVLVNVESDEVIIMELNKNSENETVINFLMNEEATEVSGAEKLIELTINTEDENKGTVKMKMNIEEGYSVIINVKYAVDYDAKIEERDTSNSIMIDNITEADMMEMYENIEENEILYSIIQLIMSSMEEPTYDYEYEYEYDSEYVY